MDIKLLELLYSDYIISSFGQITATGLSKASGKSLSHDKITRFLSQKELDSKQLWKLVKPVVGEQEKEHVGLHFNLIAGLYNRGFEREIA